MPTTNLEGRVVLLKKIFFVFLKEELEGRDLETRKTKGSVKLAIGTRNSEGTPLVQTW